MFNEMTPEQIIEKKYTAALDSVNLVKGAKPEFISDADWADTVKRNKEHLQHMIDSGEFSPEQVKVLQAAV